MGITDIQADGMVGVGEKYFYNMAYYPAGYYHYASDGGGEGCNASQWGTQVAGQPYPQYTCETLGYPSANGFTHDAFFSDPYMQGVSGHLIGGGLNDVGTTDTAVNPGFRDSAMEMLMPPITDPACAGQSEPGCTMPTTRASLMQHVPPPETGPIF